MQTFYIKQEMDSRAIKLGLILLSVSVCYPNLEITRPANVAEAFLYHQLKPVTLPTYQEDNSPSSNLYLNYYEQQPSASRATQNQEQQRQSQKSDRLSYSTRGDISLTDEKADDASGCPIECSCNKVAQIADCSNRNLVKIPTGFPKEIKRIRLERNNITELGPYVFQGLKRLQRIDLSNNNLLKIDPLAFSGGLQSLNSLILYSNKLNQLPVNLFSELNQLQLLLLNANQLQCINKELFQSLSNLNLLSLYDNNIETLANGTFDGLKNIKTM